MRSILAFFLSLVVAGALPACSTPESAEVEGITRDPDGLFRGIDLPGADPDLVYELSRRIIRTHFAGAAVSEDAKLRTVSTSRGWDREPRRIDVYVQVSQIAGGSRVSIYTPVFALRDDVTQDPTRDPWEYFDEDMFLENRILREIYDEVFVAPLPAASAAVESPATAPVPEQDGG